MDALKSPLFIICSILFLLHQLAQYALKLHIPPADAYLDNLVAMPIFLSLLVAERKILFKRDKAYRLSLLEVFLATVYVSLISELLFPLLAKRFTFDLLDFVFFLAGAALYLLIKPKEAANR
jgi:hypothetical protein